ncbi:MAG: type III polyketide synthase, partial [Cyanobacteria bacterium]|nr:type III polyketide synthase [Cyanobacteriota bacterium]
LTATLSAEYTCTSQRQVRVLERLYDRTKIESRHSVVLADRECESSFYRPPDTANPYGPSTAERMTRYADESLLLGTAACRSALEQSGVHAREITHIITVSCTGFFAPGLDIGLIRSLALSPTVTRCHIGFMGCHGALNGLSLARSIVSGQSDAKVLLCAVELCSLHFQYDWSADNMLANALFADGSAALVATAAGSTETNKKPLSFVTASSSLLIPDSETDMTWTIGDHGFAMTLSPRVPDLIEQHLFGWLEQWLHQEQLQPSDINCWAIHPGGPRILDAVQTALSLTTHDLSATRSVFARCGNMSSPTTLFILEELRKNSFEGPCVLIGFGPGCVIETTLVK